MFSILFGKIEVKGKKMLVSLWEIKKERKILVFFSVIESLFIRLVV